MYWLYEYAKKCGFQISDDGIITSDEIDLRVSLETFADLIAHETLERYIVGVSSEIRNR